LKYVPPSSTWDLQGYDFDVPTCDAYRVPGESVYGPFAKIRSGLDFSYHGCYSHARQQLQDVIIQDCILRGTTHKEPWIIFTAGAMGAGKGHVINWMSRQGYFPLPDIVHIDPDHFRSALPEWEGYKAKELNKAGAMTHRESGYIAEVAQEAALQMQKHTWVDGSLRDADWYAQVFERLRKTHPEYRIAIIHVSAAWGAVCERAASRARSTGRVVPEEQLLDSFERVPKSVQRLAGLADFVAHISNDSCIDLLSTSIGNVCYCEPSWHEVKARFADLKSLEQLPSYSEAVLRVVEQLIKHHQLIIFGKTYCSSTARLTQFLDEQGLVYSMLSLDQMRCEGEQVQMENGDTACSVAFQVVLEKHTGCDCIPQVFSFGEHIGGLQDAVRHFSM
jgi:hypothetical protein